MSKVVYIGAGDDNKFLDRIDFSTLIAVDSQPRSEFGSIISDGFERPHFIDCLFDSYKEKNFLATDMDKNRIVFKNNCQKIIYYYSFAFPNDINSKFIKEIKDYDSIICDGFIPDKKILDYTNKKITFIGTNKTIYLWYDANRQEMANNLDFELYQDKSRIDKWIRFESEFNEEKINYEIFNFEYLSSIEDYC